MLESHGIRPTPGALETRRLETRPGALPAALARHDGPAPTELSVIVFGERGGPEPQGCAASLNWSHWRLWGGPCG